MYMRASHTEVVQVKPEAYSLFNPHMLKVILLTFVLKGGETDETGSQQSKMAAQTM